MVELICNNESVKYLDQALYILGFYRLSENKKDKVIYLINKAIDLEHEYRLGIKKDIEKNRNFLYRGKGEKDISIYANCKKIFETNKVSEEIKKGRHFKEFNEILETEISTNSLGSIERRKRAYQKLVREYNQDTMGFFVR